MSSDRQEGSASRVPRAEVRERLIQAAAEMFAERGIADARLDDVAAAAGFSKGAVYSNFESKDALVAAVLERGTSSVLEALEQAVLPEVSRSQLPDVIRYAFAHFDHPSQFELLAEFRAYAIRHPEVLPVFVSQRAALRAGVLRLVESWFGLHTDVNPGMTLQNLATVLVALNVGISFDAPVLDGVPAGELVAQAVEAMLRQES